MNQDNGKSENDIDQEAERRAGLRHNEFPSYFAQLPDALVTTKRVRPDAKVLYAILHKHAAIKNLNRYPVIKISQQTLADEMDRTEETVRSLIKELLDEGWIGKHRRGKMLVNEYVLYPRSKKTWQAYVAIEKVQIRIQRDEPLAKRLRESLYPLSDHKDSCGHPPKQESPRAKPVTTSARGAY
jgi:DNA-binding Lrp family transcriptional regulator